MADILTPVLGESVAEATVGRWNKKSGDTVKKDEVLVELETDKVALEVASPADGVLTILVAEGETVTPGTVRSCGLITQSWSVRRSVGSIGRPSSCTAPGSGSTVYMKISPRPVATGPSAGSTPSGSRDAASRRRSFTSWRAK